MIRPPTVWFTLLHARAIKADPVRYEITTAIIRLCQRLHISVVVEGVETLEEAVTLRELGVRLFQGYLFAKPAVEQLPVVLPETIEALHVAHQEHLLTAGPLDASHVA